MKSFINVLFLSLIASSANAEGLREKLMTEINAVVAKGESNKSYSARIGKTQDGDFCKLQLLLFKNVVFIGVEGSINLEAGKGYPVIPISSDGSKQQEITFQDNQYTVKNPGFNGVVFTDILAIRKESSGRTSVELRRISPRSTVDYDAPVCFFD